MSFFTKWLNKRSTIIGLIIAGLLLLGGGWIWIVWYKPSSTKPASEVSSLISPVSVPVPPLGANEQFIEQARRIMDLINLARKLISDKQDLINDPKIGFKGITGETIKEEITPQYKALYHENPDQPELKVLMDVLVEYIDSEQETINKKGVGFKAFFPAVFFRVSANRFNEKMAGKMYLKLTAPHHLLRNPLNKPDSWENAIIEEKFMNPSWPKGKGYAEVTNFKGKKAYRIMIPEYYLASCLLCHGEPKGELDITGNKKEGGKIGDLDGAVSLTIILDSDELENSDMNNQP
jgi:hypothetical protein